MLYTGRRNVFAIAASVRGAFPQIGNAAASQMILYG